MVEPVYCFKINLWNFYSSAWVDEITLEGRERVNDKKGNKNLAFGENLATCVVGNRRVLPDIF